MEITLHRFLDFDYGPDGDARLLEKIEKGADLNQRRGEAEETPLHVATRRRRLQAVKTLLDHGAEVDAPNAWGKTALVHALRRGFLEVAEVLMVQGAEPKLKPPDALAVALSMGNVNMAREVLNRHPEAVRTGNPEEDRLLADMAGRKEREPVKLLIAAGADLSARGLDDGTPLHQAAWFGQPENARLLLEAGAPLEIFDSIHNSSPLGWAVHGSRYSGGADGRQDAYVTIVEMLLAAGASMRYPDEKHGEDKYKKRLLADASPKVRVVLEMPMES